MTQIDIDKRRNALEIERATLDIRRNVLLCEQQRASSLLELLNCDFLELENKFLLLRKDELVFHGENKCE